MTNVYFVAGDFSQAPARAGQAAVTETVTEEQQPWPPTQIPSPPSQYPASQQAAPTARPSPSAAPYSSWRADYPVSTLRQTRSSHSRRVASSSEFGRPVPPTAPHTAAWEHGDDHSPPRDIPPPPEFFQTRHHHRAGRRHDPKTPRGAAGVPTIVESEAGRLSSATSPLSFPSIRGAPPRTPTHTAATPEPAPSPPFSPGPFARRRQAPGSSRDRLGREPPSPCPVRSNLPRDVTNDGDGDEHEDDRAAAASDDYDYGYDSESSSGSSSSAAVAGAPLNAAREAPRTGAGTGGSECKCERERRQQLELELELERELRRKLEVDVRRELELRCGLERELRLELGRELARLSRPPSLLRPWQRTTDVYPSATAAADGAAVGIADWGVIGEGRGGGWPGVVDGAAEQLRQNRNQHQYQHQYQHQHEQQG